MLSLRLFFATFFASGKGFVVLAFTIVFTEECIFLFLFMPSEIGHSCKKYIIVMRLPH